MNQMILIEHNMVKNPNWLEANRNHTLSFYYIQQYVYIQIPNKYNTEPTFALLT